jgi:hypothetical protein
MRWVRMRALALVLAMVTGCIPAGGNKRTTEITYVVIGTAIVAGFLIGALRDDPLVPASTEPPPMHRPEL